MIIMRQNLVRQNCYVTCFNSLLIFGSVRVAQDI